MKTDLPQTIYLENYQPSAFLIDTVDLDVSLHPTATRVVATLQVRPNPDAAVTGVEPLAARPALVLNGEGLALKEVRLNGAQLSQEAYTVDPEHLTIHDVPNAPFELQTVTTCDPDNNKQLSGLYRSSGLYCTQCEAEGFRRIAYMLDRPDVLAVYTTRVEGDRLSCPVLLANGNLTSSGTDNRTGRHYAVWHDPHPKPSYLFALVGGDLRSISDSFTTASGRDVELRIYVEPGKEHACFWAMDALKRSMRWDEERFGREYDLDIFIIVAVSDFNMGAMENKGLNIFNDKLILATPETATDDNYEAIESVVAHEYYHNWTGNRITCRDWFQLCLKEGLTVFRDQEFSADERSRPVQRIADVVRLRSTQFVEDAGPLAHPVRPEQFVEINNFYTATVYVKGAELCRMLFTEVGKDGFRKALDLYFERHDGDAATVEQFLACFADACAIDADNFLNWYRQAGTPVVTVKRERKKGARTLDLVFEQHTPATPGQPHKQALPIPVRFALVDKKRGAIPVNAAVTGALKADTETKSEKEVAAKDEIIAAGSDEALLMLRSKTARVTVRNVPTTALPSVLRGFSAPVKVDQDLSDDELAQLIAIDTDTFNRWDAAQELATRMLLRMTAAKRAGDRLPSGAKLARAVLPVLQNPDLEPAYKAQMLGLPSVSRLIQAQGSDVDPTAIAAARAKFKRDMRRVLLPVLEEIYAQHNANADYSPDAESAGQRSLINAALGFLTLARGKASMSLAQTHFEQATNVTDRF
ncbi:MAG: aminopeptidase N, partial [Pseudomonadota bacterium]